jgi:hypothetical protein
MLELDIRSTRSDRAHAARFPQRRCAYVQGKETAMRNSTQAPKTQEQAVPSNLEKDPEDWVTGDESMTGAQASYLKTLSEEAGEEFEPDLTKAQASQRIDALRERTGRGIDH